MTHYINDSTLTNLRIENSDHEKIGVSKNENLEDVIVGNGLSNVTTLSLFDFNRLSFETDSIPKLKYFSLRNIKTVNNPDFYNSFKLESLTICDSQLQNPLRVNFSSIKSLILKNSGVKELIINEELDYDLNIFSISNNGMNTLIINHPFKECIKTIFLHGNNLYRPKFSFANNCSEIKLYLDRDTEYPECIRELKNATFHYKVDNKFEEVDIDQIKTYN